MHNRFDVRTLFHDRQVQQDFTGAFPCAGDLVSVEVDSADIVWFHETFADHGR